MTDAERNKLYAAWEELLARQQAIEYLTVEFIAVRFKDMSDAAVGDEIGQLMHKLRHWPPIWPLEPLAVEEKELRLAQLRRHVSVVLRRAAERASHIAMQPQTGGGGGAG